MTMRKLLHLIWVFTVAVCSQELYNSTTEIPTTSAGQSYGLVDGFADLFGLTLTLIGLCLNTLTLDVSRHQRPQTSGSKWMQYLAIWDSMFILVCGIADVANLVAGYEMTSSGDWACRGILYTMWFGTMNASGHLVALAVDRALNMSFPQWHHMRDWSYINRRLSIGMTLFHAIVLAPIIYLFGVQDGVCSLVAPGIVPRLYELFISSVLFPVTHFTLILVASVVFEYKLRERRTPGSGSSIQTKKCDNKETKVSGGKGMELGNIRKGQLKSGLTKDAEDCPNSEQKPAASTATVDFIYGGPDNRIRMELPTPASQGLQRGKEVHNEDKDIPTWQPQSLTKPEKSALNETNVDTGLITKGKTVALNKFTTHLNFNHNEAY